MTRWEDGEIRDRVLTPSRRPAWVRWLALGTAPILLIIVAWAVHGLIVHPSNDRDWTIDQSRLATAEIDEPLVTIRNIRNFRYRSETDFEPAWYDATFDLRELENVWFVVEPFGSWRGLAHTFVSFGFEDQKYVAFSVEIRKEKGEAYSPLKGLWRQYELMYVVGDERDLIGLRANHRNNDVYLYPVRTTRRRAQRMFLEMVRRANQLAANPEFYNTITNACTTNLVDHVNLVAPDRIPLRAGVIFPGYSDRLARQLGLIDTELPPDELRARFRINEPAGEHAGAEDFSVRIREHLPAARLR
ncbi:MAG: DUF4105 domain-containing protein [Acidobacteria bacterium]|nr:DUF4105 domain-containing protein [Acidobacteriota bacterium]